MATGGVSDSEEELYSFELFECSVCLQPQINNQPRLLPCGHTFCTPCLNQVVTERKINCPTCRNPVKLSPGGVEALPININLGKMRDREQELSERYEKTCQMCKKTGAKPAYLCTTCPKRLICPTCYNLHQTVPILKTHQIFVIDLGMTIDLDKKCDQHGELIEYFCSYCEDPLCMECICATVHNEHSDQIVDYETGARVFKQATEKKEELFNESVNCLVMGEDIVRGELEKIKDNKEMLVDKCVEVQMILDKIMKQLNDYTSVERDMTELHQEINKHLPKTLDAVEDLRGIRHLSTKDFIWNSKELWRMCESQMRITRQILSRNLTVPNIIEPKNKLVPDFDLWVPREETLDGFMKSKKANPVDNTMDMIPRPVLEIKAGGAVVMESPFEVISAEDGTVILICKMLNYLQRIDREGNVVKIYNLNKQSRIMSGCIFNEYLFVSTPDNTGTEMCLDDQTVYRLLEEQGY